jgi:hypothetical protein
MKLVTTIQIRLIEEAVDETEASIIRQSFENGAVMEESRVQVIEEMVSLLSLRGEKDDVHVSFNLIDDEEDDEE